jgi:hypothetical protein
MSDADRNRAVEPDEDLVPASPVSKLLLAGFPFALVLVVFLLLRWIS